MANQRSDGSPTGKIIVFTAPSGAGKTTLVRHLLTARPDNFEFSVSATTRKPRKAEKDGHDYYFLAPDEFQSKVAAGEFLEYEEVYQDQFYGTLHSEIERVWAAGKALVFDVEVKGAGAIKAAYPDRTQVVFVAPPSPEVLFDRLRARGTEDDESLKRRIARAAEELGFRDSFDLVLVNDDLVLAKAEAIRIADEWIAALPLKKA